MNSPPDAQHKLDAIWEGVLNNVRMNITHAAFETYYKVLEPVRIENNKLIVKAPPRIFRTHSEKQVKAECDHAVKKLLGDSASVVFLLPTGLKKKTPNTPSPLAESKVLNRYRELKGDDSPDAIARVEKLIKEFDHRRVALVLELLANRDNVALTPHFLTWVVGDTRTIAPERAAQWATVARKKKIKSLGFFRKPPLRK